MRKLKLYLDTCCFNRPFDDLTNDKVRLESEAILTIIDRCESNKWDIIKSDILYDEILEMPNIIKRQKVLLLYSSASDYIKLNDNIVIRAKELMKYNIKPYDSLHLASAEYGNADVFLTTDKKLINLSKKSNINVRVENPNIWLMEVL